MHERAFVATHAVERGLIHGWVSAQKIGASSDDAGNPVKFKAEQDVLIELAKKNEKE